MALQATSFSVNNVLNLSGKSTVNLKESTLLGVSVSDHHFGLSVSRSKVLRHHEARRKVFTTQAVATTSAPPVPRAAPEGKKTLRKGTAIITGASSGLGLATAKALAETGK
ncbi:protochlorophyllide reductase, chloroplastic-like [Bidens hawaiensis]|uniref:protochlorophyllide reductase, chloroplastic-like n=1 Tax=Bidens hawaiensis TaxID=980011 RepID=UPI004049A23E